MAKVGLTLEAKRDLAEIWAYVGRDNEMAADRLTRRLREKCQRIAENPAIGRPRPELGAGLSSSTEGRYLIVFRRHVDGIDVVRIVHGARDVARLFS